MFRLLDYFFYCFYCVAPVNGLARSSKATTFLSLLVSFLLIDLYVLVLLISGSKIFFKSICYLLLIVPLLLLHWRYYKLQSYEHILAHYQINNLYRARYAVIGIATLLISIVFPFIVA